MCMWVPLGSTFCFLHSSRVAFLTLLLSVFFNNLDLGQASYAKLMRTNPGSRAVSRILDADLTKLLAWQSVFFLSYAMKKLSIPHSALLPQNDWVPGWLLCTFSMTLWTGKVWTGNSSRSCTSFQTWCLCYNLWGCAIMSWAMLSSVRSLWRMVIYVDVH